MYSTLSLSDIMPKKHRSYDKNRAPKIIGQPTVVYFHVTVLSLDSVNEESMTYVTDIFLAQRYPMFEKKEKKTTNFNVKQLIFSFIFG